MRRRLALLGLGLAAGVVVPPAAGADTLAFVKGGNVWLARGDGSAARQLTAGGGWESPTQTRRGVLWAVRKTDARRVHRLDRASGRVLQTLEPVPVDDSSYVGPLSLRAAPDGRTLAFHYLYTGSGLEQGFKVAYSATDGSSPNGSVGDIGEYVNPTWLDSRRVAVFQPPDFSVDVQIDDASSRSDSAVDWIADGGASLGGGSLNPRGGSFAAMADGATLIRIYPLTGAPPTPPPVVACEVANPAGKFGVPVWSPDGGRLAWGEGDGIHIVRLRAVTAAGCDGDNPRLVLRGGAQPDWSAASPPPLQAIFSGPAQLTRSALRAAVRCPAACRLTARLSARGRILATGSGRRRSPGALTIRLRVARGAGRALARAPSASLRLSGAGFVPVSRKVSLR